MPFYTENELAARSNHDREIMRKQRELLAEKDARIARLEKAAQRLIAWDAQCPKGRVYNTTESKAVEDELTAIIEELRAALGEPPK